MSSRKFSRVACLLFVLCACKSSSSGGDDDGGTSVYEGDSGSGLVPYIDAGDEFPDASAPDANSPSDAERTGCGDGRLQSGEACDDGNDEGGDGCSADCKNIEADTLCPAPGSPCVSTVVCGDGRVSGQETCDDGNTQDGDGCDKTCKIQSGYRCGPAGQRCIAAKCGDGVIAGSEACDDGNDKASDGCSPICVVESGYTCPAAGKACRKTVCNDGVREGAEPCDDGNQVVGDGCTPFCDVEPDCGAGACHSRCGDGLMLPDDNEQCDDGNTRDHDGCSAQCKIEPGYTCKLQEGQLPDKLEVPVTYRDLIAIAAGGGVRHPDFQIFKGSGISKNLVMPALDSMGKPVFAGICTSPGVTTACPYDQQLTTKANFDQWYRDVPAVNVSKVTHMTLTFDATAKVYRVSNSAFFPWDGDTNSWVGKGKESLSSNHDYGFTSEIRTYFEFKPDAAHPQTLTFLGDDDVWVFINRKLAVDIGGLHSSKSDSVVLDAPTATKLDLTAGKIYEIALFHAERHTTASNFNLTLDGFVSTKSECAPKCGDGIVAGTETCDDGKNDGRYGSCTAQCQRAPNCGDGVVQADREECDDGVNLMTYSAGGKAGCAPGCKLSAFCGDGKIDSAAGEECDGMDNNMGGYGECTSDCQRGLRCGDKVIQVENGENCDDGNLISGDGCSNTCRVEGPQ